MLIASSDTSFSRFDRNDRQRFRTGVDDSVIAAAGKTASQAARRAHTSMKTLPS
jgi:hypothetical protein